MKARSEESLYWERQKRILRTEQHGTVVEEKRERSAEKENLKCKF